MRILVVNWLDPHAPRAGGAELHLEEVFGRLAARGHQVTIVSSGWAGVQEEEWIGGMRIVRVGRWWSFPFAYRQGLKRAGGLESFDVVIEDLNKLPLGLGREAPIPAVLLVHHIWGIAAFRAASIPLALVTWLSELGLAWTYRGQSVITVSASGKWDLVRRGFQESAVTVVENGIGLPVAGTPGESERLSTPTFVYVGRLQPYKRLPLLVEAIAALNAEGLGCRAIVAGTGPAAAALKRLIMRRQLSRVVEVVGFVSDAERHSLFQQSWAHVQPSCREGWGLTVMEAAAAGTCSIAANTSGLCDTVEHNVTGLLVPNRFLPTFTDALRYVSRNPVAAWRMGHAAQERARGYTWDRAALGVEALLQRVVGGVPQGEAETPKPAERKAV